MCNDSIGDFFLFVWFKHIGFRDIMHLLLAALELVKISFNNGFNMNFFIAA